MSEMGKTNSTFKGKSIFSLGGLLLVLIILILVNVIFSGVNWRVDATEDRIYSLSQGTKTILSNLDENVVIKVFYTKDNVNTPVQIKNYAQRVLDFLAEYDRYGGDKLEIEVYNPQPDSEEEEWAQKYGIEGANLPGGETLYLGMAVTCMDQEESIKMLDPAREESLEYDITRMISRVRNPEKQKIGVISPLPVFGSTPGSFNPQTAQQNSPPWTFITELQKTYEVKEIKTDAGNIDEDLDLLVLIHPRTLSDKLQYAVDQYVLKGNNAVVFADPLCFSDQTPSRNKSSSIEKLFLSWGIEMDPTKVVVDFDYATELVMQNNVRERNPTWLLLDENAFNSENIITSNLETMLLPIAGAISKVPDSENNYEPLLQSSENSAMDDAFKMQFGAQNIRRDFSPTVKNYDLAVQIDGKFKTAFPGGPPKDDSETEEGDSEPAAKSEPVSESRAESTIIVIADADMISDIAYVRKQSILGHSFNRIINDNLNFMLNVTEVLTGSRELIGIRSRGKFRRPFTKVQEIEKEAESKWLEKEQELARKFEEMNRKLNELERRKDSSQRLIISEEQEAEINRFKDEKLEIQKELKIVRRNLRKDTEMLGLKLKIINIGLMPLIVCLCGIFYAVYRRKRINRS